jgi:aminoglycoside phosphotransferase
MNKDIKIFHYEDSPDEIDLLNSYYTTIKNSYKDKISISHIIYNKYKDLVEEITVKKNTPDIIILDMYDENSKDVGTIVLELLFNNNNEFNIPTIIYTGGSGSDRNQINYPDLRKKYRFLHDKEIIKSTGNEDLKETLKNIIDKHIPNEKIFTIDQDDYSLKKNIQLIGESNLKQILSQIKKHLNTSQPFSIKRMSSGFSGATVFKLNYDNKAYFLKFSNDKEKLKSEYEKRKDYAQFPSIFRNGIIEKFETQQSYAILIENVHSASTLFDWLENNKTKDNIENCFKKLYDKTNGLCYFYANNIDNGEKAKFTQIFDKLKDSYAYVRATMNELEPITEKYKSNNFNRNDFENLVLNGNNGNINKSELTEDNYQKSKILCHGDFHSNNIMVQGNDPIIIDTDGIRYDYWCMDICRLIVHLFIAGYDRERLEYFDISKIPNNLTIAKDIIASKKLSTDSINDGYIYAINWLIKNVKDIYGTLYCEWEFQLGLCKEFLQMSYRVNSVPPNKRTIALLSAYECMVQANESILIDSTKMEDMKIKAK